jgi:phosphosulfolactate phosphohydrolase-like enzyme
MSPAQIQLIANLEMSLGVDSRQMLLKGLETLDKLICEGVPESLELLRRPLEDDLPYCVQTDIFASFRYVRKGPLGFWIDERGL